MAGTLLPDEGVSLEISVEELSIKGQAPPPQFLVEKSTIASADSSPAGAIPIIDVGLLSSKDELEKLRSALSSEGCFQAVGHGVPSSFLDQVRQVAKQFFALPAEEKQKYSRKAGEVEGYGPDLVVSQEQVLDWSSRLFLRVFPEDQRRPNLWPETPNNFREMLHEYSTRIKSVMDLLFKAMAKSLDLEENSFSNQFGETQVMQARFNFYPPCARPDVVLGVKPHTDRSAMTVLLQDGEVEGLQVLVEDGWVRVPIVPHALLVNLGDQMQIMSNGIFKSVMHRVVTNTERMRISVAMFNEPKPDREIGPVDGLIDEKRPRLYRNVKNYGFVNYECFQKGKTALETVRI